VSSPSLLPERLLAVDWPRVALCGLVTGFVWHFLSAVALGLVGDEFLAALVHGGKAPSSPLLFVAIDLGMGVWAVWLYASLRTRRSSRMRTAGAVGAAWWTLKTLQSAKWAGVAAIPWRAALGPLLATLPAALVATAVGSWLFDHRKDSLPTSSGGIRSPDTE